MLTMNSPFQTSFTTQGYQSGQDISYKDWTQKGESAFSAGNLTEAKQCFEKALALAPFDAKLHNNLSVIYWQQGKKEEALNSLTRALELDRDDQDVIINCSKIFKAMGKERDARDILEAYLARKPWDFEAKRELENIGSSPEPVQAPVESFDPSRFFNEEGERQFENGKAEHARLCFEMAIEHNPNHARAYSNLGVVCWQQGDLQRAMEYLYKALDIDSEDSDILYNCSMVLTDAGRLETAANLLKFYLRKNPKDEAAWEDYNSLIRRIDTTAWRPDGLAFETADIYIETGKKLAEAKDYLGAAEAFHRALAINPDRAEVLYFLGQLHLQMGQKAEALETMREGLRPGESFKMITLGMGEILVSLGHRDEARKLYMDYLTYSDDEDVKKALDDLL